MRVGCPIRISTDQRLLAAPRGFSQRATSFIASWCQGIHRMPFLYSISRTRPPKVRPWAGAPHHAQKPSSGYKDGCLEILCFPHTTRSFRMAVSSHCLRNPPKDPSDKIVHRASEPSPSNRWGAALPECKHSSDNNSPGQTSRLNNGMVQPVRRQIFPSHAPRDAPEPDSHFQRTNAAVCTAAASA